MRQLGAILLNPPLRSGVTTTERNVASLAEVLGCERYIIANLCVTSSKDLPELSLLGQEEGGWLGARPMLRELIGSSDELVAAWGQGGLGGLARQHWKTQLTWLGDELRLQGTELLWTVGGTPRHPSRWRQYVGPQKGRGVGETFEQRLKSVLVKAAAPGAELSGA